MNETIIYFNINLNKFNINTTNFIFSLSSVHFVDQLTLVQNRRGTYNLWYCGYAYRKKVQNRTTINWVCLKRTCKARLITHNDNSSIRLGAKQHNHLPRHATERKTTIIKIIKGGF
jgi:hypothetical protein